MLVNASNSQKAVFSILAVSLMFNIGTLLWIGKGYWDRQGRIGDYDLDYPPRQVETLDLEKCTPHKMTTPSSNELHPAAVVDGMNIEKGRLPILSRDKDISRKPLVKSASSSSDRVDRSLFVDADISTKRPPPVAKRRVKFNDAKEQDSEEPVTNSLPRRSTKKDRAQIGEAEEQKPKSILRCFGTSDNDKPIYQAYRRPSYAPSTESKPRTSVEDDLADDV